MPFWALRGGGCHDTLMLWKRMKREDNNETNGAAERPLSSQMDSWAELKGPHSKCCVVSQCGFAIIFLCVIVYLFLVVLPLQRLCSLLFLFWSPVVVCCVLDISLGGLGFAMRRGTVIPPACSLLTLQTC